MAVLDNHVRRWRDVARRFFVGVSGGDPQVDGDVVGVATEMNGYDSLDFDQHFGGTVGVHVCFARGV